MSVDALTLAAVVDELRRIIVGGRIQHVTLPAPLSIGLEVFRAGRRYQLLASANPRSARLHLVAQKPTRGVEQDTPLLLLLRKYVRNGVVTAVEQPPLERIAVLSITKYPGARKDDEDDGCVSSFCGVAEEGRVAYRHSEKDLDSNDGSGA